MAKPLKCGKRPGLCHAEAWLRRQARDPIGNRHAKPLLVELEDLRQKLGRSRADLSWVHANIEEASAEVYPDFKAATKDRTEFLMNRRQLADFARRSFRVAVENIDRQPRPLVGTKATP